MTAMSLSARYGVISMRPNKSIRRVLAKGLTPWLTGAGSRRLEGTNISHEDAEGMAYVGVRVEPTVRLGREVEGGSRTKT